MRRNVFLTVKESLHNIIKHAQASQVHINISINKNLVININDNGIGFTATAKSDGNGLKNMKKRVESVGGQLAITGLNGTAVKIDIPL